MNSPKTAKEYLQQLQWMDTVINQKIKELDDLCIKLKSIKSFDYSKERVQTSPSGDAPFVGIIERMDCLEKEINIEIDKFTCEKHKIINQIQGLSNGKYVKVLYKRYVEFKQIEVIAKELGYTKRHSERLHNQALLEFEKNYLIKH